MVRLAAWLPVFAKLTIAEALAPPFRALRAAAPLAVTAIELPLTVPDTVAFVTPLLLVATRVCEPCGPIAPPLVIATVTVQVPPLTAAVQLVGDTE